MCGIAGVLGHPDIATAKQMSAAVAHRGPDHDALLELADREGEPRAVFAHRRLSVIDLSSSGNQPMSWADGRFVIAYNGEVYNFRALRDELSAEGLRFTTESDTEVLIAGLATHGASFLDRVRGMFALAFWDRDRSSVLLARDPFGMKPLYCWQGDGLVLFASEVRALLASGRVPRELCDEGVRSFLETGSVSEPRTIIRGVEAIPPGTAVEVEVSPTDTRLGKTRRFTPDPLVTEQPDFHDDGEARRLVRQTLRDSVEHHLVSDVPVGCFLSGGIDSSVVVALASEARTEPVSTFTVVFSEDEYSEREFASAVARRFGTRHQEIPLGGSDLLASLPDAFGAMDQPSLDGLNTFVVSGAVRRQGIKVALAGLGGDELFGGYPSFRRLAWAERAAQVPGALRRLGSRVAGSVGDPQRTGKLQRLLADEDPARGAYAASRMLFDPSWVDLLMGSSAEADGLLAPSELSPLQRISWYETTGYMRNTLLRDSDVFSMAHGLELRVPFVDREVASVAVRALRRDRLDYAVSKPVLVDAMEDLLPSEVWDRPKKGFTLPFALWLRGELRAEVSSRLGGNVDEQLGLGGESVRGIWEGFLAPGKGFSWSRPWALYTLMRWAEANNVMAASGSTHSERSALAS